MAPIAFIPPALHSPVTGPVPMWPYILASFAWNTTVLVAAMLAKQRWGITAPALFGLASASLATSLAARLFFSNYHRKLLPSERRRLTLGCFVAFWFYDEFLRIVVTLAHGEGTAREIMKAIAATIVDFALVWVIVRCIDLWAAKRYASAHAA